MIKDSKTEYKSKLTDEQYDVLFNKATEAPPEYGST